MGELMKSRKIKVAVVIASVILVSAAFLHKKSSVHSSQVASGFAQVMGSSTSMSRSIAQAKSDEVIPVVEVPVQSMAVKTRTRRFMKMRGGMQVGLVDKDGSSVNMAVTNTTSAGMPMLSTIQSQ
jgi:hypothetical protein